jgi:CubicO group peptidase (beta-lactamase class C family)
MYQPGERWMYNTGSDVLGVLIARVARQPLGTFLRERIFEPLGMKDTDFSVPPAKIERFATQYATRPPARSAPPPLALEVYDPAEGGEWSRPPAFPSGGAGLVSTVDDFLAFGLMMLNGGEHGRVRILSRPSIETMTCDQLLPEQKAGASLVPGFFDSHGWGFGVAVVTRREDPAEPIDRFGWDGGLGTSWYADPREELTTILMTQVGWATPQSPPICRDFWTLAYTAIAD